MGGSSDACARGRPCAIRRRWRACARLCRATFWRLTPTLWCSVSTIAPIIAVSSTNPAAWNR